MHELTREVGAPSDFGTEVMRIDEGEPLLIELRLESVVEGVLVTGSVRGTATGACVRCLDPVPKRSRGRSRSCSFTPSATTTTARWGTRTQ